jgi:DNA repair photolyase
MRWDNLRQPDLPGQEALFGMDGFVTRTFDTPEFRGMTFYEVRAKSIINKVPGMSRVPFSWTINPYRGCSHACVYCLSGDTPILMADGRTKPLARVREGDVVYGTLSDGGERRFALTEVLAHWATRKQGYYVRLDDGTELIASGDHRFLTPSGWKYVADDPGVYEGRPFLRPGEPVSGIPPSANVADLQLVGARVADSAGVRVHAVKPMDAELRMYDITTGTGDFVANGVISHNCFARRTHEYLDLDAGADFDSKVVVKLNAPELLRKELASPKWTGEHIAMGTNVDCYQRAEGRYRLMPEILGALRDARNPYSILTKGTLLLRDLPLLQESAEVTDVSVAVSVGSTDADLWRTVEPGTPSPRARLAMCSALTEAGLKCAVLMAPILPYLSDSPTQLAETVRAIAEAGAASITPIVLHLRPGAREWYLAWLAREHPALVPRYERLYARGSYAPKEYSAEISGRVRELAKRYRLGALGPGEARRIPTPAAAPP